MRHPLVTLSLVAAAAAFSTGCATTSESITFQDDGTPRHEHGWQDWWNYQFVYHPNDQVYFEPYSGTYHWFADGTWRTGEELPATLNPEPRLAQVVFLQEDEFPWGQHNTNSFAHAPRKPFRPANHDAVAFARVNGWLLPTNDGEAFATVSTENDRPD